jgi:integrase
MVATLYDRVGRLEATHEKGGKDRAYPAAPEFAEFLQETPEDQRTGYVFNPIPSRTLKGNVRAGADLCGRTVARFGDAANVVVDKKSDDIVYASSHDLRRSFGLRWSRRVMPPVLQELMRHESIDTTMKYYVGQDAQSTAAELYAAIESGAKPQHLPQPKVAKGKKKT